MQKKIIVAEEPGNHPVEQSWLNLEEIATVELTSEDTDYPIEAALAVDNPIGWRAGTEGKQMIRFAFKQPQQLKWIKLSFVETETARTQQYVLRYSSDAGNSSHEILRQQWNFSPEGATGETEEHELNLQGVTHFELIIIPDISGGEARASLQTLQLGE